MQYFLVGFWGFSRYHAKRIGKRKKSPDISAEVDLSLNLCVTLVMQLYDKIEKIYKRLNSNTARMW